MANQWHEHKLRVHYKETDQMAVVHHANYVSWFEIGRTEMMRDGGISYHDMEEMGLILPVLEVNVKYHKPAHYDDYVVIYTKISHYSPVRLQFDYEVRKISETSLSNHESRDDAQSFKTTGELLATGSTLHMWLNQEWKPARIDKIAPKAFQLIKEVSNQ